MEKTSAYTDSHKAPYVSPLPTRKKNTLEKYSVVHTKKKGYIPTTIINISSLTQHKLPRFLPYPLPSLCYTLLTSLPALDPSLTRPQLTLRDANSASGGPWPGSQSQHSPPRSRCTSVARSHEGWRGQVRRTQKMCLHVRCLRVTFVHIFSFFLCLFLSFVFFLVSGCPCFSLTPPPSLFDRKTTEPIPPVVIIYTSREAD